MSLTDLPNELLFDVIERLDSVRDMNAIVRTNRRLYSLAIQRLYRLNVSNGNDSALPWAAKRGYERSVDQALKAGANFRPRVVGDRGPLHRAAEDGHAKVVALLLKAGADPNEVAFDATPLLLSLKTLHVPTFKLLVDNGADVGHVYTNLESLPHCTIFHIICLLRTPEFAKILLEKGADVNETDWHGETPLHWAVSDEYTRSREMEEWTHRLGSRNGKVALIRLLLAHGASPMARNAYGVTPQKRSRSFEHGAYSHLLGTSPALLRDKLIVRGQRIKRRLGALWRHVVQ